MNYLTDNFNQILEFAKKYGLPMEKKRAIIREFLQSKVLDIIYSEKISAKIVFVGGTSLRLLRGIDRFSEDLDFDFDNLTSNQIDKLVDNLELRLNKENMGVSLYKNKTQNKIYYELRFKNLLSELKLSSHVDENLTIKLDFEDFWKNIDTEVVFFNRYGFLVNVITATKDQILFQKLTAYLNRSVTQSRDIYDIVWLVSQGAMCNDKKLIKKAKDKFSEEEGKLTNFKNKLKPFLLDEKNAEKLNFFSKVLI